MTAEENGIVRAMTGEMSKIPQGGVVACAISESFADWLAESRGSIVATTYQAGKVAIIGWDGRQVTLLLRDFPKPLGLAIDGERLALATREEVWLFGNAGMLAHDCVPETPGRYDALFLPRAAYFTRDLHIHDIAFGADGLWLVNTRFSCLAQLSDRFNFAPCWRPKFVSDLVPEDRCHLNGLALRDHRPKYVTALGNSDVLGGWRANKAAGGLLIDVTNDEMICAGLCMPHSPRCHNNQLWILNSGAGELLLVDSDSGRRECVTRIPGYLRGLCFVGNYALIGMSQIREVHIFGGLPIQNQHGSLKCGIAVVDLVTGSLAAQFEFTAGCTELYDVQFLPGIQRPMLFSNRQPATHDAITSPDSGFWLRPRAEKPTSELQS